MREACGTMLLKTVEVSSNYILYPHMMYCYVSLAQSIQSLLSKPNFFTSCEAWTSRSDNYLQDVYDGKIWQFCKGKPFLSDRHTLGLTMNIDWFQPFKHTTYSVGAVYLTIMNLPRDIRYKRENVILCGLIPSPKEPCNLDPFLEPLVSELLDLWKGIEMSVNGNKRFVRGALICVACDIPAGRKVCGFHNAHYGCSRCMKHFPGSFGSIDYSGFERSSWESRSPVQDRKIASSILKATTKSEAERMSGYRPTALLKLPYFNPSRMLVVDPMHNLFIGTAKRIMKNLWLERGMEI